MFTARGRRNLGCSLRVALFLFMLPCSCAMSLPVAYYVAEELEMPIVKQFDAGWGDFGDTRAGRLVARFIAALNGVVVAQTTPFLQGACDAAQLEAAERELCYGVMVEMSDCLAETVNDFGACIEQIEFMACMVQAGENPAFQQACLNQIDPGMFVPDID